MKRFFLILSLFCLAPLFAENTEQPPVEVKDNATNENFRQIFYANDSLNALLTSGTSTQVLVGQGSGSTPIYQYLPGLTVQTTSFYAINVASSTTAASFIQTGVKVAITPRFSTSKIKISFSGDFRAVNINLDKPTISLFRNGVNIAPGSGTNGLSGMVANGGSGLFDFPCSFIVQDPTATTTTATTYEVYLRTNTEGTSVGLCTGGTCSLLVEEISQ